MHLKRKFIYNYANIETCETHLKKKITCSKNQEKTKKLRLKKSSHESKYLLIFF
jgi:hypothetical protein